MDRLASSILISIWIVSLIPFMTLGCISLLGLRIAERWVRVTVRTTTILGFFLTAGLILLHHLGYTDGSQPVIIPWIRSTLMTLDLVLGADLPSLYFVAWSWIIGGAIGRFSSIYLQGAKSYQKFMILLLLLQWGVVTVVLAARLDLLMMGWEVVGVASVLLIGFMQDTKFSGSGSLIAFTSYKISDIGLLLAGVLLHHIPQLAVPYFYGIRPDMALAIPADDHFYLALALGAAIIFGSLAKGSQFPFVTWLPRAMEGPTPSSAAFYGALSVHLGPLLLLKLRPYWAWSEILVLWVFVTGAITVLYGVLVGRTVGNYKTQLAYGIMVQIGIIYLEVALGYDYFAMLHLCGHGALRTFQFLRAGSILRDFAENPLFYPLRNDRAQTQSSRFFAKQRYFEKMREKIYSLAWNEFYMAKINSALGLCAQKMTISRTAIFRWFFSLIVFMQVGVVIAPINQALQVHLILVLGCVSVLAGFNAPRLRSRMQTIIMAHLSIFLVCFKTGVLSHSNWMAINSLLIFLLITVSFKLAEEMAQRVKSLQAISPSMGLAVVFPRQSSLFLAVFFILGISPGSLLFLAEDLLLEHMVEYGFGSLVLFLTLGLFLAVFLYRTYSQVFMGYDHQLKGFLSEKISPMIWFGRLLVVVSIVISMVPLGS